MKESIKTILLFLGLILSLIFAPSCTKERIYQDLCITGDCESQFIGYFSRRRYLYGPGPHANNHGSCTMITLNASSQCRFWI